MRKGLFTTNDQKPMGPVKPQPLNTITTKIIPTAEPRPEPKGTDLSKMITTHDDDKVAVKVDEPINMGADTLADKESGKIDAERVAAPSHKKPGRKKKG